jgi:hypothetical protein
MLVLQEFCTSRGFQERARDFFEGTLGLSVKSEAARWLGVPGALRGAEAMDSIVNFVDSAQAGEGESVIGHILCGIVELGGVVYVLIVLIVLTLTIPLAQVVNFFVGIAYDTIVLMVAASQAASEGGSDSTGSSSATPAASAQAKSKKSATPSASKSGKKSLANVFSRSRNKSTSKNTDKEAEKAIKRGEKPPQWPNKDPLKFATQNDVNLAIENIRKQLDYMRRAGNRYTDEKLVKLSMAFEDLERVKFPSLDDYTVRSVSKLKDDLRKLQNVDVAALRNFAIEQIAKLNAMLAESPRKSTDTPSSSSARVFSRNSNNNSASTNPFDASLPSGVFAALADRAVGWLRGGNERARNEYDEVSPASEDEDATSDDGGGVKIHMHSFVEHGESTGVGTSYVPSRREQDAMQRLGGVLPPV